MLQHALNRGIITTLALFFALAAFLASGGFVQISLADEEADQLEAQVKSSADAYNDAILRQEELTAEIAELDARIAELEAKLPAQRERSDESIRALYKYEYDSSSVLMMLLESKSVTDMLAIVDSYNWIIEYNTSEIQRAIQMESDLRNARQQLETDKADVDKAAQDALTSLQEAREAVSAWRRVRRLPRLRNSRPIRTSSTPRLQPRRRRKPQTPRIAPRHRPARLMSAGRPISRSS